MKEGEFARGEELVVNLVTLIFRHLYLHKDSPDPCAISNISFAC
jgi:hypothetical protein